MRFRDVARVADYETANEPLQQFTQTVLGLFNLRAAPDRPDTQAFAKKAGLLAPQAAST